MYEYMVCSTIRIEKIYRHCGNICSKFQTVRAARWRVEIRWLRVGNRNKEEKSYYCPPRKTESKLFLFFILI